MDNRQKDIETGATETSLSGVLDELTEATYERFTSGEISFDELQTLYNHLRELNKFNLRKPH